MSFAREISAAIESRLLAKGFKKRYGVLWREIGPKVRGFLGLGRATYDRGTVVTMFPIIGVRYENVYEIQERLGGVPKSKTNPTLSAPLGYLVPNRMEYAFQVGSDPVDGVGSLLHDVEHYALPFYEAFSTPMLAAERVKDGAPPYLSGVAAFVPTWHLINGSLSESLAAAESALAKMDITRGTGKQYTQFVQSLQRAAAERERWTPHE